MRNQFWMAVIALNLGLSSCILPTSRPTEAPASIPATGLDTPTSSLSASTPVTTETPVSIELPTITPTSTPSVFLASTKDQPVNCRFGPATSYAIVGFLILGRQAEIIGRNEDSSWWYVRNPSDPSTSCWLSINYINVEGNVELLPVVGPPEIMVNSIKVDVEPAVSASAQGLFFAGRGGAFAVPAFSVNASWVTGRWLLYAGSEQAVSFGRQLEGSGAHWTGSVAQTVEEQQELIRDMQSADAQKDMAELQRLLAQADRYRFEAEQGTLSGVNFSNSSPGYSGSGFVTGFDNVRREIAKLAICRIRDSAEHDALVHGEQIDRHLRSRQDQDDDHEAAEPRHRPEAG